MEKERKVRFGFAGLIVLALFTCGIIGYLNRSSVDPADTSKTQTALPGGTPAIELQYCSGSASLCVISFGLDSEGNMLIVLMNSSPVTQIYARINQDGTENLYTCKSIGYSPETFYCLGSPVTDGTFNPLEVYASVDNRLLASGKLQVMFGATPAVISTQAPTITITPAVSATTTPTLAATTPIPTVAYPNPTSIYPNPTVYPNPGNRTSP